MRIMSYCLKERRGSSRIPGAFLSSLSRRIRLADAHFSHCRLKMTIPLSKHDLFCDVKRFGLTLEAGPIPITGKPRPIRT